ARGSTLGCLEAPTSHFAIGHHGTIATPTLTKRQHHFHRPGVARSARAIRVKIRAGARAVLCGERFEVDFVPELLELTDEAFRTLLAGAAVVVVGAEILVGEVLVEDVVGGDEDRVAEGAG